MKGIFITLLLLCINAGHLYSQDSLNYKSKWQTRPNYGVNFPITKMLDGRVVDNLYEYGDNSRYWQVLSIAYFFHRHWGIEFNFQGMTSSNISKRTDAFLNAMKSEYGNNYYVTPSTGAIFDNFNLISGNFERGFIGLIYRYEKNRFIIYPKFSIGVNSFYADWRKVILKEKNSNNLLEVSFKSGKRPNDNFIVATSTALGYKMTKRFYLNLDLMTSYYKTNITFTKNVTDLNTNISTSTNFEYKKECAYSKYWYRTDFCDKITLHNITNFKRQQWNNSESDKTVLRK